MLELRKFYQIKNVDEIYNWLPSELTSNKSKEKFFFECFDFSVG